MNASLLAMHKPAALQRGFSLITTLILLIVVTVLGLAASRIVLMSEKTSRFDRDTQIAFQAAEAALVDAEIDIQGTRDPITKNYIISGTRMKDFPFSSGTDFSNFVIGCGTGTQRGLCAPSDPGAKPVWYNIDFTDESANARTVKFGEFTGRTYDTGQTGIRPETAPRYIVDHFKYQPPGSPTVTLYRITAMGFGPRKETQVVLQVVFRKES